MGTYNLPRNVKGEGRILFVFSTKSLLWTVGGMGIGLIFYVLFKIFNLGFVGMIAVLICGFIGFLIGTLKVPNIGIWKSSKIVAGEKLDDVIIRAIKFKNKNKIYIYDNKEEKTNAK